MNRGILKGFEGRNLGLWEAGVKGRFLFWGESFGFLEFCFDES